MTNRSPSISYTSKLHYLDLRPDLTKDKLDK